MKTKLLFCFALIIGASAFAQDTTSNRMVTFNWADGIFFYDNDTATFKLIDLGVGGTQISLFQDLANNRLLAVLDSSDNGVRRFYEVEPFTGANTVLYTPTQSYFSSADVAPSGHVYAVTGNGLSTNRMIYRVNVDGGTETLLGQFDPGTNSPVTMEYSALDSSLYIFQSYDDSVYRYDLATNTVSAVFLDFLNSQIKGACINGSEIFMVGRNLNNSEETLYHLNGQNLSPLLETGDWMVDIEFLDLVGGNNLIEFCPWDSVLLASRFESNSYKWYKDGVPVAGGTVPSMYVDEAGVYRLLVEIGDAGDAYMWSEQVTVVELSLAICTAGLNDESLNARVYPTLTNGWLNIDAPGIQLKSYSVVSMSGAVIMQNNMASGNSMIDVSALPSGLYSLLLHDESGKIAVCRFVRM